MSELTIYFVRHGKTLFNLFNRMQGWVDSDLTEDGKEDAIKAGKRLAAINFDCAYSSNTGRAEATRDLVVSQLQQRPSKVGAMPEFREVLFGYYEGLDSDQIWNEIGTPYGYHTQEAIIEAGGLRYARELMKKEDPSHMAETYDEVINRWQAGIDQLQQAYPNGAKVLIVTHGTSLRMFADHLGIETLNNYPENGSISTLTVDADGERFTSYNQKD
ncbi:MAG: histidine phosphatase family protein [Lactobacillus sp.]|nr:MAG: histidine phosphatase family protein [Lactobacillus sp.]